MHLEFKSVNLEQHFDFCVEARKDAYLCSFETYDGFSGFLDGYRERVLERLARPEWFYIHVWVNGDIAGQLEFRSVSSEHYTGYVHLLYLKPEYRGIGLAQSLHDYFVNALLVAGCVRAVLSVSRKNLRAMKFYQRNGWEFVRANPKHAVTDFYQLTL